MVIQIMRGPKRGELVITKSYRRERVVVNRNGNSTTVVVVKATVIAR